MPTHRVPAEDHIDVSLPPSPNLAPCPLDQQQRHPALRLALPQNREEEVVVSRRGRGGLARLESPPPINRYAGDWSICGRDLLSGQEADYDEVAGSESDGGKLMSRTVYHMFFHLLNKDGTQTFWNKFFFTIQQKHLYNSLLILETCLQKQQPHLFNIFDQTNCVSLSTSL